MTNVNIVCKQLRWSVKQNHCYYCHILGIYNHLYQDGPYLHQFITLITLNLKIKENLFKLNIKLMHIYIPNVGKHQDLCFHLTSHTAYNDPSYPLQKIISSIIITTAWLAITYIW